MSVDTTLIVRAAPIAVTLARAAVKFLESWMKTHGSNIEIRVGGRVISTIKSMGDQSELSKLIQDELVKDKKKQSENLQSGA
jgi:hypothetical protein